MYGIKRKRCRNELFTFLALSVAITHIISSRVGHMRGRGGGEEQLSSALSLSGRGGKKELKGNDGEQ